MKVLNIVQGEMTLGKPYQGSAAPELVLIVYDTGGVQRIHNRDRKDRPEALGFSPDHTIVVTAKYAVCLVGRDDSDMIAQYYATRKGAREAEWSDSWYDLPAAIDKLRDRHSDKPFPEEIAYVVDWPYHRHRPRPQTKE